MKILKKNKKRQIYTSEGKIEEDKKGSEKGSRRPINRTRCGNVTGDKSFFTQVLHCYLQNKATFGPIFGG